jgi:hypothetical protein
MAKSAPLPTFCSIHAQKIIDACEQHWDEHSGNCSGFVKAVAASLGIVLSGQANDIVDFVMDNNSWYDVSSGPDAALWAEAAYLVVGGLKGSDQANPSANGHVVIVVPGPVDRNYPTAYWGQLGGTGKKKATINWAWSKADRDNVIYRASRPTTF